MATEKKRFSSLAEQIELTRKTSVKHELAVGMVPMLFILLSEAGFMLFLVFGLHLYFTQQLELAVFLVFLIASVRVYRTLAQLALTMAESRFIEQAAKRLAALLATPEIKSEGKSAEITGKLTVTDLGFSYDGPESATKRVIDQISFSTKPGTLTAIAGPSGSGKSTLLHLLARF